MTDKEKLVELIDQARVTNTEHSVCINGTAFIADHLIANGVTIQKWISVKEALPEQDTLNFSVDVLICTNDGYVGVGCMCKYSHRESGWTWAGEDGVAVKGAVTHWMPLPPAPKGE